MPPLRIDSGRIIALDTETTGQDLHHGAVPFYVSTCDQDGNQAWWEWDVCPLTRRVLRPPGDDTEVVTALKIAHEVVLHNAKFDAKALVAGGVLREWDWGNVHDTLIAAHLLHSNRPKDLTSLTTNWLGHNLQPYEDALERAVKEARQYVRSQQSKGKLSGWRITKKGDDDSPSAKDKTWKHDCWLPRALRQLEKHGPPEWDVVLRNYANPDSWATIELWKVFRVEIERLGLWEHYLGRMKILPVLMDMERCGVTINNKNLTKTRRHYATEYEAKGRVMVHIAASLGSELILPKGGRNKSLDTFCFDVLKLPPVRNPKAKTSRPSLDSANAVPYYLDTLPPRSKALTFVKALADRRTFGTAIGYLDAYRRFMLPLEIKHLLLTPKTCPCSKDQDRQNCPVCDWGLGVCALCGKAEADLDMPCVDDWYLLHPNINPTGTDLMRRSSSNPNSQNVSDKSKANLRGCFGPRPGREWWSFDAQNLELRIPAYESGEKELIDLFERSDEPPYYGSEHLLNFSTVYPDIWQKELEAVGFEEVGATIKIKYNDTWYQRCKNGDFAVGYGAVDRADGYGTADRAFGRPGSHARLKARFSRKEALNQHWIRFANKHGYVETMPVNGAKRGYPLLCSRTTWGGIKPTVPLNAHVQGTAGEWMGRALVRVHEQLGEWRKRGDWDGYITLEVHDELVLDVPVGDDPRQGGGNLRRACAIAELMEQGGKDIGVPTPVSMKWHPVSWDQGHDLTKLRKTMSRKQEKKLCRL